MTQNETSQQGPKHTGKDRAIELLVSGSSASEAAETVGVSRSTLHRWSRDPDFEAELNRRRQELREASQARLEHLCGLALKSVEEAIESGDSRVALVVLKGMGLLAGHYPAIGPTDAKRITRRREAREQSALIADLVG